jgi:hypothetical protein
MSCATFGADSIGSKVRYARAEHTRLGDESSSYATRHTRRSPGRRHLSSGSPPCTGGALRRYGGRRSQELEAEIVEKLWDSLNDLKPAELANALRNVGVSKAINLDKAQLMRGKPTEIVERRDADQLIRTLQAAGVIHVDSDAEEIEEAQDDALPPAA